MTARDCLKDGPCTAPELAAELGITLRQANARLQALARKGAAYRTDRAVIRCGATGPGRGRYPHLWELVDKR